MRHTIYFAVVHGSANNAFYELWSDGSRYDCDSVIPQLSEEHPGLNALSASTRKFIRHEYNL